MRVAPLLYYGFLSCFVLISGIILRVIFCRECAVKFNDYFEFPRQLDMVPYTVQGLAKLEGLYLSQRLACFVDFDIIGSLLETAYHFLAKCNAMMMVHYFVFGAYLMEPGELQKVQPHTL